MTNRGAAAPAAAPLFQEVEEQEMEGELGSGKACHLHSAVGSEQLCPGEACPFWEAGTPVLQAGCAIERLGLPLEFPRNPQLAHWLLGVRTTLEMGRDRNGAARHLCHELLPPGLRD